MTDTPWTTAEPDRIDIADEPFNGPSDGVDALPNA
jgi:hypothetical protein